MADPGSSAGPQASDDVTGVLNQAVSGNAAAREHLYAMLYGELVRLARSHLAGSGAVSLNPSAIVHEAYVRMLKREATPMRDRRAFFAYASSVMRSVLIDHMRERAAEKRGGGLAPLTLTTGVMQEAVAAEDFSRLNDALLELRQVDDRCFQVVEMRYFAGMTEEDIAQELSVSVPTVKRDWRKARAFLFEQLR
jgi:RNA polymerase sigma factor (TIGR02999 family)